MTVRQILGGAAARIRYAVAANSSPTRDSCSPVRAVVSPEAAFSSMINPVSSQPLGRKLDRWIVEFCEQQGTRRQRAQVQHVHGVPEVDELGDCHAERCTGPGFMTTITAK